MLSRSAPLSLENFEDFPFQIPDSSCCFGINLSIQAIKKIYIHYSIFQNEKSSYE